MSQKCVKELRKVLVGGVESRNEKAKPQVAEAAGTDPVEGHRSPSRSQWAEESRWRRI